MFLKSLFKSFSYAFNGIALLFKNERNIYIHFAITILVIIAGIIFPLSKLEWIAIVIAIALVFTAETFNSAIEKLCDHVTPEYSPKIKVVKDLSAAAVFLAAICAAAIGLIVFIPKVF